MRAMAMSNREVEIKLAFPSVEIAHERLLALGATIVRPRHFEDNTLFDLPDGSLRSGDRVLRLRRVDATGTLTCKGPSDPSSPHKSRIEIECVVDDPGRMRELLELLGFRPAWRYQKWRTAYRWKDLDAFVDETPLGCFVELEGNPEAIDRGASLLGFSGADYVKSTYYDLAAERTGADPRPLIFPSPVDAPVRP